MATSSTERMNLQGVGNLSLSSKTETREGICARCGGLQVLDTCTDMYGTTSDREITARRCIQCGDIVDSVILQHRRTRHTSSIIHPAATPRRLGIIT